MSHFKSGILGPRKDGRKGNRIERGAAHGLHRKSGQLLGSRDGCVGLTRVIGRVVPSAGYFNHTRQTELEGRQHAQHTSDTEPGILRFSGGRSQWPWEKGTEQQQLDCWRHQRPTARNRLARPVTGWSNVSQHQLRTVAATTDPWLQLPEDQVCDFLGPTADRMGADRLPATVAGNSRFRFHPRIAGRLEQGALLIVAILMHSFFCHSRRINNATTTCTKMKPVMDNARLL
jgi:hypothetical protein